MRINKKLLAIIFAFLLTGLVIILSVSSVLAAVTVPVYISPSSGPPGTVLNVYGTGLSGPATYTVTFGGYTVLGSTTLTGGTVNTWFNTPVLP